jgi:hypothetical protein
LERCLAVRCLSTWWESWPLQPWLGESCKSGEMGLMTACSAVRILDYGTCIQ